MENTYCVERNIWPHEWSVWLCNLPEYSRIRFVSAHATREEAHAERDRLRATMKERDNA